MEADDAVPGPSGIAVPIYQDPDDSSDDDSVSEPTLVTLINMGRVTTIQELYRAYRERRSCSAVKSMLDRQGEVEIMLLEVRIDLQGQRGRERRKYTTLVAAGNSHSIGLGIKRSRDVDRSFAKAIEMARVCMVPVVLGQWDITDTDGHTVPQKVTGVSRGVKVTLIPAPKHRGIVSKRVHPNMLELAGVRDCYVVDHGPIEGFGDLEMATYLALSKPFKYMIKGYSCKREIQLYKELKFSQDIVDNNNALLNRNL